MLECVGSCPLFIFIHPKRKRPTVTSLFASPARRRSRRALARWLRRQGELIWFAARERLRRQARAVRRWGVQGGLCPPWPPEASHQTKISVRRHQSMGWPNLRRDVGVWRGCIRQPLSARDSREVILFRARGAPVRSRSS